MDGYQVKFRLQGQTPLLMHQDDVMLQDTLTAWRKDKANKNISVAGDDRSPGWTWQTYLYNDGEHVAMPADCIMACLRQAGAQIVMKKQKTFKELTQSSIEVEQDYCAFGVNGDVRRIAMEEIYALKELPFVEQFHRVRDEFDFELFVKRARVGQQKHVRVRPMFRTWHVEGSLLVTAKELTRDILREIFDVAERLGLCDWRAGCKTPGKYGRYRAELKFVA